MTPRSLFWLALAPLLAGALTAQATVFKGPQGGTGDVWVYPGIGGSATRPPELQGIVLLEVDAAGRSPLTQFQPDQPRLKRDLPLASRILLPQGQGSLYRYKREHAGGADYGYFVVRPNGLAEPLASFPGSGPLGLDDPIPNPVALSGQGDALLTATTRAAGGDLFEIELASGTVHTLTSALAPLEVLPQGLILLPTWGAAITRSGALRFARQGNAARVRLEPNWKQAALGSPVRALTHFGNGLVASADGGTVAVIGGVSPSEAHVFAFGPSGAAVCVNESPAPILDPGFGTQSAPQLALSPNGQRAAWKVADAISGEVFSRRVSLLPSQLEVHVTADQSFTDTLNDTGVIAFFDLNKVGMLVGEPNGAGGIENADLYQVTFPANNSAPTFENVSNTSGDGVAPFLVKGDIETSDGFYQVPGQPRFVYFVSGSSGQGKIIYLDAATRTSQLVRDGIAQLDFVEHAGTNFVLGLLHDQPHQRELIARPFDPALPSTSLGIFPGAQTLARTAGNAAGVFTGILNVGALQQLGQVSVPSGLGNLFGSTTQFGPMLGFDGSGAVLTSIQTSTRTLFVSWKLGGSLGLYDQSALGLVLPAN